MLNLPIQVCTIQIDVLKVHKVHSVRGLYRSESTSICVMENLALTAILFPLVFFRTFSWDALIFCFVDVLFVVVDVCVC